VPLRLAHRSEVLMMDERLQRSMRRPGDLMQVGKLLTAYWQESEQDVRVR